MSSELILRFAKISRFEKPLSVLGFLLLACATGYCSLQWSRLHKQIVGRIKAKEDLTSSITQIQSEIDGIKNRPVRDLVVPKVIAVPTGLDTKGRPLYNFIVWIEVPASRQSDIAAVNYHFPDPSFILKDRIGKDSSNSFAVSYVGGGCPSVTEVVSGGRRVVLPCGCLGSVGITIIDYQGVRSAPIVFDECSAAISRQP